MSRIVMLSGSPSANSRSDHILKYLGKLVEKQDFEVSHISVRNIPQEDLFTGNYQSPAIQNIVANIESAQGIVIASPVYKGAYTGVLKALIDVLPQDILEHKPALPIMTGGSLSHLLAIEYALKPLVNI